MFNKYLYHFNEVTNCWLALEVNNKSDQRARLLAHQGCVRMSPFSSDGGAGIPETIIKGKMKERKVLSFILGRIKSTKAKRKLKKGKDLPPLMMG